MGEGADDGVLLPYLTSVNIACGGHAGDEETMARTVEVAKRLHLAIGAHPGYPDRSSFGRRELELPEAQIEEAVISQVRALERIAAAQGSPLSHVKPHGALYNQAARDERIARAVARALRSLNPELRLIGLAGSILLEAGRRGGLRTAAEAFADRRYRKDGSLAPRSLPGSLIEDAEEAGLQALRIATGQPIATIDHEAILIHAETLCLHSDTRGAAAIAKAVRRALEQAGVMVAPLSNPVIGSFG